jgi:hypothetical protein
MRKMGWAWLERYAEVKSENLKGRYHLEGPSVDGR